MPEQKRSILAFDWAFLFYWLMATTFGWLLGWLLLPTIALVTAGVAAGVVQGLLLMPRIHHAWHWIATTAVGWTVGVGIALFAVPPGLGILTGAVIGATTGTAQWGLLRFHVRWAGWWIAVSVLAWATALSFAPASGVIALPPLVMSGVMAAVPTGLALELLLRNRKGRTQAGGT